MVRPITRPRRVRCPECGGVYTDNITDRHYRTCKRTFGYPEVLHNLCLALRCARRQREFEARHGRAEQDSVDG